MTSETVFQRMEATMKTLIGLSAGLGIMSATQAFSATAGPTVELTFVKGYDRGVGLGRASIQDYRLLREGDCLKSKSLARFSWANGPTKTVVLPGSKFMRFEALTRYLESDSTANCNLYFGFTPEAGRRYRITQNAIVPVRCDIEVIDLTTNAPPSDLMRVNLRDCVSPSRRKL
jgi:hypothetical protein